MMNILLIEDDAILNDTISHYLQLQEYQVTSLHNGMGAVSVIDQHHFDIYIIDINIPGLNGLDLVRYIRQKDLTSPIIMITASMELDNLKVAYSNGCSDYIKKPFYLEELDIRINKLISNQPRPGALMRISDSISYDFEYEELTVDGEIKRLRKKERRLLHILLKNINKTLTAEVIENYVWENEIRDSYPLRQLVTDLRKHLNDERRFIFSDRGIGYRLEIEG
jgi:two-component system OmpR family response regulator